MSKINITDEIRRITNETAATATAAALKVAEDAKSKAAEVSSLAISKALDASTLAATRAAEAAAAAAQIAASTSKDLEYIKKDIADTKQDIKSINDKLDNKYSTKEDLKIVEGRVIQVEGNISKAVWIVMSVVIVAILSVVVINYKG